MTLSCSSPTMSCCPVFFFFQAEDGIRYHCVTGVQTCALPISYLACPAKLRKQYVTLKTATNCAVPALRFTGGRQRSRDQGGINCQIWRKSGWGFGYAHMLTSMVERARNALADVLGLTSWRSISKPTTA